MTPLESPVYRNKAENLKGSIGATYELGLGAVSAPKLF
jgi:hypothetical protein